MRTLSAIAAVQGDRVRVVNFDSGKLDRTLVEALEPHQQRIAAFADSGGPRLSVGLGRLWDDQFPMVLPPATDAGLGVAILNSNAETYFSFTNALGMVSVEQAHRLVAAVDQFPEARWIIALHHHLMEYPMSVSVFSERVGTALINGSWFVRRLRSFAARAIVMHGHRHMTGSAPAASAKSCRPRRRRWARRPTRRPISISTPWHPARTGSLVCFRRSAWRSRASLGTLQRAFFAEVQLSSAASLNRPDAIPS
jgi:hypothetical protein